MLQESLRDPSKSVTQECLRDVRYTTYAGLEEFSCRVEDSCGGLSSKNVVLVGVAWGDIVASCAARMVKQEHLKMCQARQF